MKNLTNHKADSPSPLEIDVLDEPGNGGACHEYLIRSFEAADLLDICKAEDLCRANCHISFQNGPINEVGVNGIDNESLLAIVEHRLQGFQSGSYPCRENALALTKIQEALVWLHYRTNNRLNRGVEGTSEL